MAKAAKTAIKAKSKDAETAKNFTKVVRAVKSKSGSYTFKEAMVHKDKIKEFLANG